jgi:hypothetical protein
MTYEEFHARTGYVCGDKEFWGIVSEYNHSPLCKDEFCKRWKKMNRERIVANKCAQNRIADIRRMEAEALDEYFKAINAYKLTGNRTRYYQSVDWYESYVKYKELAAELSYQLYHA